MHSRAECTHALNALTRSMHSRAQCTHALINARAHRLTRSRSMHLRARCTHEPDILDETEGSGVHKEARIPASAPALFLFRLFSSVTRSCTYSLMHFHSQCTQALMHFRALCTHVLMHPRAQCTHALMHSRAQCTHALAHMHSNAQWTHAHMHSRAYALTCLGTHALTHTCAQ
eukprot:6197214-Pleurochrysis_carterae.AAC.1